MAARRTLTREQARRVALAAQGFGRPRPTGRVDVRHFRKVVDHVQVVQIDSVNVFARAHQQPFFSRLGPYDRDALDRWMWTSGDMLEVWAHVACLVPMAQRPWLGYRRSGVTPWKGMETLRAEEPDYLDEVLAQVRAGTTTVKSLEDPGKRTGPWWGMPKGRVALDWLFHTGAINVSDRDHQFTCHYDVPERVVPPDVLHTPDLEATAAHVELIRAASAAHGVGTVADLADYHRLRIRDAKVAVDALVEAGELIEVQVADWDEPAYMPPGTTVPRSLDARALLCPFDPVVWFRPRIERLWDFHYRIEIYTPAPKRTYGYYVLPFLLGEDLVGRVDVKHDRKRNVLLVPGAFTEDGVDRAHAARELAAELAELAGWLGAEEIEVGDRGDLVGPLRNALG